MDAIKSKARLLSLDEEHWTKLIELATHKYGDPKRSLSKTVRDLINDEWEKAKKTPQPS